MELLVIILWIASICINTSVAKKKRRDGGSWVILGILLGPVSTVWLLCLPESNEGLVKCPYCAEHILAEAKVCKHCGRDQVQQTVPVRTISPITPLTKAERDAQAKAHPMYKVGRWLGGRGWPKDAR